MSVTLDGIDITGLVKEVDFGVPVRTETQVSNDGSLLVYQGELMYNALTLVGGSDWGWLSQGILLQLQALASVIGAVYVLEYEGTATNVRFRTEDVPAIDGNQLVETSVTDGTTLYNNITVKLMEV